MTADAGLILSRFVHYAALLFAFGVCFFPVYAFPRSECQAAAFDHWSGYKGSVFAAALIALLSGLFWLIFTAASMAGSISAALSRETLTAVLSETGFGLVWSVRLCLLAVLAVFACRDHRAAAPDAILVTVLSAASLASLAGVGHTQGQEGAHFVVRLAADGIHLLAAGAWLGGLVPLLGLLAPRSQPNRRAASGIGSVLTRFSGMGYAAVVLLAGTGAINSWYLVPSLGQLPNSLYGQFLTMKLGLFILMLLLAAMNRFWLVPRLLAGKGGRDGTAYLSRLRWHVAGEAFLGVLIIALVSMLGMSDPPESS